MSPNDPQPEIPALGKEQRKERKGGAPSPKPLLSSELRVRSAAPSTVVERLKGLRRKDVAFIAAGLSVLCMAPIAEHLLMGGGDEDTSLEAGFDRRGPLFPEGASVYEGGTGALSPGGLLGEGTDVITPLNVRDPSALVLGPGAVQKPPTGSLLPKDGAVGEDWKNAIKQAASRGGKAAAKKAKLPMPHPKMAGTLRGLTGPGGGSPASLKLDPLSAANVPNRAKGSQALSRVQSAPGYRGVAMRAPAAGSGAEGLKAGGNRQADIMNKSGAINSLDSAARESMPSGGTSPGGTGAGAGEGAKDPGANQGKDNKSISVGENLELLRAKMEMEKAIDLKWKKKAWTTFERQKLMEELLIKTAIENVVGKGLFEPIGKSIAGALGSLTGAGAQGMSCVCVEPGKCGQSRFSIPMSDFKDAQGKQAPGWPESAGFSCVAWPGGAGAEDSSPGNGTGRAPESGEGLPPGSVPAPDARGALKRAQERDQSWEEASVSYAQALGRLQETLGDVPPAGEPAAGLWVLAKPVQGEFERAKAALEKAHEGNHRARELLDRANQGMELVLGEHEGYIAVERAVAEESGGILAQLNAAQEPYGLTATAESLELLRARSSEVDRFKSQRDALQTLEEDYLKKSEQEAWAAGQELAAVAQTLEKMDGEIGAVANFEKAKMKGLRPASSRSSSASPQRSETGRVENGSRPDSQELASASLLRVKTRLSALERIARAGMEETERALGKSREARRAALDSDKFALDGLSNAGSRGDGARLATGYSDGGRKRSASAAVATEEAYRAVQELSAAAGPQKESARRKAEEALAQARRRQEHADAAVAAAERMRDEAVSLLGSPIPQSKP